MKKIDNKIKKDVTNGQILSAIEQLAEATGLGFERVNDRLDILDGRMSGLDKRMDDLQYQFNRLETYILRDHDRRLETLEHKMGIKR